MLYHSDEVLIDLENIQAVVQQSLSLKFSFVKVS
jgi:hypothetical protein